MLGTNDNNEMQKNDLEFLKNMFKCNPVPKTCCLEALITLKALTLHRRAPPETEWCCPQNL